MGFILKKLPRQDIEIYAQVHETKRINYTGGWLPMDSTWGYYEDDFVVLPFVNMNYVASAILMKMKQWTGENNLIGSYSIKTMKELWIH